MAILAIFIGKGITKSHYEALRGEVDRVHRRPEGLIFHAAAFDTAGGIRVADVWESQEALDDFFNKRLLPEMKKLNVSPPTGEFYPLYNANAYVGVNRFKPTR